MRVRTHTYTGTNRLIIPVWKKCSHRSSQNQPNTSLKIKVQIQRKNKVKFFLIWEDKVDIEKRGRNNRSLWKQNYFLKKNESWIKISTYENIYDQNYSNYSNGLCFGSGIIEKII